MRRPDPFGLQSSRRPSGGFLPPGMPFRAIQHKEGNPIQTFRKVWVDRDKYSPLKGMKIDGNEEARAAGAEEARTEEEARTTEAQSEGRAAG